VARRFGVDLSHALGCAQELRLDGADGVAGVGGHLDVAETGRLGLEPHEPLLPLRQPCELIEPFAQLGSLWRSRQV